MNNLNKNLEYFRSTGHTLVRDHEDHYDQLLAWSAQLGISTDRLLRKDYQEQAQRLTNNPIKLLVLDVDGVMTDGGMYYSENEPVNEFKKFNAKDGMAIMRYIKNGGQIAIISSGKNINLIRNRASHLGIQHIYTGRKPKLNTLKELCAKLRIGLKEVAMVGDDVNDFIVLKEVGLSACPSDAVKKITNLVDVILEKEGGKGCVREFIDNYLFTN